MMSYLAKICINRLANLAGLFYEGKRVKTDTTELAQRMKAAAVRAKTATEEYASGRMSVSVCYAECEEFNRLTDGPDNILALVEALEKAQQDHRLHAARLISEKALLKERIAELEESNAQVIQSRDHYKRMTEEGLKQLAESRTVKLPKRCVGEVMHMSGFSRDYGEGWCADNDNAIHEMRVAGIKVEGE